MPDRQKLLVPVLAVALQAVGHAAGAGPAGPPGLERPVVVTGQGYFPVALRLRDGRIAAALRGGAPHLGVHGRLDVYLLQNGGPKGQKNRPYRQQPDGTFRDVSAGHGMGVAVGDGNNDGRPDVLVTRYGGVGLLLNNGNGTFTDVTRGGAGQSSGPARGREGAVAHLRQALTFTPRAPAPGNYWNGCGRAGSRGDRQVLARAGRRKQLPASGPTQEALPGGQRPLRIEARPQGRGGARLTPWRRR